jgi:hypothetical protein
MIKRALMLSCVATMAATGASPAMSAPWTRGYVVGFYEFAFRYGGRADYARGSEIEPGVDCPHGSTTSFSDPVTAKNEYSLVPWRTAKEVEALSTRIPLDQRQGVAAAIGGNRRAAEAYRGYKSDIETYVNPFAANDPGEPQVTSRIGEGFNLDGKIKPADFVSPDGERGIDNNLYRAWGCDAPWRGNGNGVLLLRSNDKMLEGLYTIVIRLSGNKDPMNDDEATLEIGYSPDKIMKDARGAVGVDYSYRIIKGEQYTKLKARIKNGIVETEQSEIHMPQIAWFPDQNRDADFRQGKIRLAMNPDGTASGLVGGYRDWRDLYAQDTYAQDGGQQGGREHEDHVGLYYALRRNADGMFNAKTGSYDGISSAYRMKLAQAFVMDPATPMGMPTVPEGDMQALHSYDVTFAAFVKGTDTRVPQPVPAGSNEQTPLLRTGNSDQQFKKNWTAYLMKNVPANLTMTAYQKLWPGLPAEGVPPNPTAAARAEAQGRGKLASAEGEGKPALTGE